MPTSAWLTDSFTANRADDISGKEFFFFFPTYAQPKIGVAVEAMKPAFVRLTTPIDPF